MGSKKNKAFRVHRDETVLVAVATRAVTNDDLAEVSSRILRKWARKPARTVLFDLRQAQITPCPSQPPATDPLMAAVLPVRVVYLVLPSMMDWLKPRCERILRTGLSRIVIDDPTAAFEAAVGWDHFVAKDRAELVLRHVLLRHVIHPCEAPLAAAPTPLREGLRPTS